MDKVNESEEPSFIKTIQEHSALITLFSSFLVAGSIIAREQEYSFAGYLLFVSGLFGIIWVTLKVGIPFLEIPESGWGRTQ